MKELKLTIIVLKMYLNILNKPWKKLNNLLNNKCYIKLIALYNILYKPEIYLIFKIIINYFIKFYNISI